MTLEGGRNTPPSLSYRPDMDAEADTAFPHAKKRLALRALNNGGIRQK